MTLPSCSSPAMTGVAAPSRAARRQFLQFLAGSPLLAPLGASAPSLATALLGTGAVGAFAQSYDVLRSQNAPVGDVISAPEQAIDVFEFEEVARRNLPPAHFGYLTTGVDGDKTLRANQADYDKLRINVKRLVDVRKIDTSIEMLGSKWASPIFLCPISSQAAFHSDAEIGVAKACRETGHEFILSTVGNSSIEDVGAALGRPAWFMLYPTDDWSVTQAMVGRAEAAKSPAVVLTVDRQGGRNTETLFKLRRTDTRQCVACHAGGFKNEVSRKPMFENLDVSRVSNLYGTGMNWDFVDRLKRSTKMKLVLKGIMSPQDAATAVSHGVDAIIVSNHGGRAEESLQSTIGALPGVVAAVKGRIPVMIDGGVRRGTDVLKALALGASAVGVGRPYCWGLAAFGEPGVAAVMKIMQREFETIMRQVGATTVAGITRQSVA